MLCVSLGKLNVSHRIAAFSSSNLRKTYSFDDVFMLFCVARCYTYLQQFVSQKNGKYNKKVERLTNGNSSEILFANPRAV